MNKMKNWMDYLWIYTPIYLLLGMFNILFAWIGMIEFILPLLIAIFGGGKAFCNFFCGRGQLFTLLGTKLKLSRKKNPPAFLSSLWFRYGFLTFFMTMFIMMVVNTLQVLSGAQNVKEVVTLLWTFKVPWHFAYQNATASPAIAQFAFGLYSLMFTSSILGFLTMLVWKPRSWCVYCPMGTMTQGICKLRNEVIHHANTSKGSK